MRRGILILLTSLVLLWAVSASAASPTDWDPSSFDWWSYILSMLPLGETTKISSTDEALPHLDPDGLTALEPATGDEDPDQMQTTDLDPDPSALPHLDPDG